MDNDISSWPVHTCTQMDMHPHTFAPPQEHTHTHVYICIHASNSNENRGHEFEGELEGYMGWLEGGKGRENFVLYYNPKTRF